MEEKAAAETEEEEDDQESPAVDSSDKDAGDFSDKETVRRKLSYLARENKVV